VGRWSIAGRSGAIDERRTLVLATFISGPEGLTPGARIYLAEDGAPEGSLGDAALDARAVTAARTQLDARRSALVTLNASGGPVEVFVEVLVPPLPLLVCGAGHDTLPVVRLAHELGWWVMVADSRPAYATRERFPGADEVVLSDDADVPQKVRIDRHTFVVVMTHNFLHDRTLLRALLVKLFSDRQIPVEKNLITYLITHMERSCAAARAVVEELDREALRAKRPVTRAFAADL